MRSILSALALFVSLTSLSAISIAIDNQTLNKGYEYVGVGILTSLHIVMVGYFLLCFIALGFELGKYEPDDPAMGIITCGIILLVATPVLQSYWGNATPEGIAQAEDFCLLGGRWLPAIFLPVFLYTFMSNRENSKVAL